jgi:hypothetical protein
MRWSSISSTLISKPSTMIRSPSYERHVDRARPLFPVEGHQDAGHVGHRGDVDELVPAQDRDDEPSRLLKG